MSLYLVDVGLAHGRPPVCGGACVGGGEGASPSPPRHERLPEALVERRVENGVGHGRRDAKGQGEGVQHKLHGADSKENHWYVEEVDI